MALAGPPGVTLLRGIVGSKAYGFETPESDTDRLGVFATPTEKYLVKPQLAEVTWKSNESDHVEHEAAKAMRLLTGCNPTVMELLWLPGHEVETVHGRELVDLREKVLSAPLVKATYLGYAKAQATRMLRDSEPMPEDHLVDKRAKNARHVLRLIDQGLHLYTTGELQVRVPDPERYFTFGVQAALDPQVAADEVQRAANLFETVVSPIPEKAETMELDNWLLRVRKEMLTISS